MNLPSHTSPAEFPIVIGSADEEDSYHGGDYTSLTIDPVICGNTTHNVRFQFNNDWVDVLGTVHPASGTVMIGANPILLEGQQSWVLKDSLRYFADSLVRTRFS